MATIETLVTAEQYLRLPDPGSPTELVRGQIVMMNVPYFRHGEVCGNVYFEVRSFVNGRKLGRVLCNDSGVITQRTPDSVRGADVAYYSFKRVPKGKSPRGYAGTAPELVFEVLSPDDRPKKTLAKVAEYLNAGVLVVCVVDPQRETVMVYYPDRDARKLTDKEKLALPEVLPGFSLPLPRIFA